VLYIKLYYHVCYQMVHHMKGGWYCSRRGFDRCSLSFYSPNKTNYFLPSLSLWTESKRRNTTLTTELDL